MELKGKVVVITGAGSGIGAAMATRFASEEPSSLVIADLDYEAAVAVAEEVDGHPFAIDVADEDANRKLVGETEDSFGPIDLFCANAGVGVVGNEQSAASDWEQMWRVNTLSHVHAAKFLVPGWLARGKGYFLSTASAAGLLTNLGAAQYSVTKHAAVAFAEWLAVTYGDRGIGISCLCPQFVDTPLVEKMSEIDSLITTAAVLDPAEVADVVVNGLREERFLILPHPEVAKYFQNKASNHDRWISGMQKLRRAVLPE